VQLELNEKSDMVLLLTRNGRLSEFFQAQIPQSRKRMPPSWRVNAGGMPCAAAAAAGVELGAAGSLPLSLSVITAEEVS
jgi:hypothetical protein